MKVFIDPLDREKIEGKLDAVAQIYQKLTTHKVSFHFARPNSFQKKVLDAKKQWAFSIDLVELVVAAGNSEGVIGDRSNWLSDFHAIKFLQDWD